MSLITVKKNVPLQTYTTLGVGGFAEYFVEVSTNAELAEAVSYAQTHSLSIHVIGGGSNVLVADEVLHGLVIHISSKGMLANNNGDAITLTVQAGEELDDVVSYCVQQGWWGMENLSHIPGTVGASPIQNVGAYGVEVKDVINSVQVFNIETEKFETITNSDCAFSYRNSFLKSREGKKYIVTAVTFLLSTIPRPLLSYRDLENYFKDSPTPPSLLEIREAVISIRGEKFPNWHEVGTAGSFFKNPIVSKQKFDELLLKYPDIPGFYISDTEVKIALGWILDKVLHLKGYTEGQVATYTQQALVIVVQKNATALEVEDFAKKIMQKVQVATGIDIEFEVTLMK